MKNQFPPTGLVRLKQILAPQGPVPVSRSSWWKAVREKRYPAPVKLGPRITAWHEEDIINLLKNGAEGRPKR